MFVRHICISISDACFINTRIFYLGKQFTLELSDLFLKRANKETTVKIDTFLMVKSPCLLFSKTGKRCIFWRTTLNRRRPIKTILVRHIWISISGSFQTQYMPTWKRIMLIFFKLEFVFFNWFLNDLVQRKHLYGFVKYLQIQVKNN